uniref:Chitin-binding type-2 domain-containing protein n=1 Tax=Anopheles dirus TaxID=7168 RepID=A0A182MXM5_9DIPT
MDTKCYVTIFSLLLLGSSLGEIIVDSRAKIALQRRSIESDVLWCDVFYADDFPDNSECERALDGQWYSFPACCNGAYNCLNGGVWDIMLCPAQFVYDGLAEKCVPFTESECPQRHPMPGDEPSTEQPPISCGTIRTGKLPYAPDCTKYIQCRQGEATLADCPAEYVFYIPFAACLPGEAKQCALFQL